MYTFSRPLNNIAVAVHTTAAELAQTPEAGERQLTYLIFDADPNNHCGVLKIIVAHSEYGISVTVNAQLLADLGRANQVTIERFTIGDLAYAIGFTCGSAFWRCPR